MPSTWITAKRTRSRPTTRSSILPISRVNLWALHACSTMQISRDDVPAHEWRAAAREWREGLGMRRIELVESTISLRTFCPHGRCRETATVTGNLMVTAPGSKGSNWTISILYSRSPRRSSAGSQIAIAFAAIASSVSGPPARACSAFSARKPVAATLVSAIRTHSTCRAGERAIADKPLQNEASRHGIRTLNRLPRRHTP